MEAEYHSSAELGFDRSDISQDSLKIIESLKSHGHDGLLVGGCVRDLILGLKPKDFDVVTDARPRQICEIFPFSRIIGRRFKIVHVRLRRGRFPHFVEVTTYRANLGHAKPGWLPGFVRLRKNRRARTENVYGTRQEDVMRRDFTVNALYYDPLKETVIDYLGGISDIKNQMLRMIGNSQQRFGEDPARIIRAIRFQAKLGFDLEDEMRKNINKHCAWLNDLNRSRLYDETVKFFNQGAAKETWRLLFKTPLGNMLFPQIKSCRKDGSSDLFFRFVEQALTNTDQRVHAGLPVVDSFFIAVVFWKEYQTSVARNRSGRWPGFKAHDLAVAESFSHSSGLLEIPYRVRSIVHEIWWMQTLLERRQRRDIRPVMANRRFRAAYDFMLLRSRAGEIDPAGVKWWAEIQKAACEEQKAMIDQLPKSKAKPRKRRGRSIRQPPQSSSGHVQGML